MNQKLNNYTRGIVSGVGSVIILFVIFYACSAFLFSRIWMSAFRCSGECGLGIAIIIIFIGGILSLIFGILIGIFSGKGNSKKIRRTILIYVITVLVIHVVLFLFSLRNLASEKSAVNNIGSFMVNVDKKITEVASNKTSYESGVDCSSVNKNGRIDIYEIAKYSWDDERDVYSMWFFFGEVFSPKILLGANLPSNINISVSGDSAYLTQNYSNEYSFIPRGEDVGLGHRLPENCYFSIKNMGKMDDGKALISVGFFDKNKFKDISLENWNAEFININWETYKSLKRGYEIKHPNNVEVLPSQKPYTNDQFEMDQFKIGDSGESIFIFAANQYSKNHCLYVKDLPLDYPECEDLVINGNEAYREKTKSCSSPGILSINRSCSTGYQISTVVHGKSSDYEIFYNG
ncbi:MAG: hypothetical protein NT058_01195, partial [Candidatus Portnoybacteria bacterium]|nr:hypothetical protein [Candidatus Portnoybacteria bacterium]